MLFPIPAEELWQKLRELVRAELRDSKPEPPVAHQVNGLVQKPLYKASEVCEILHVSRQTLHQWRKEGLLKSYKIKSRLFFLWADVERLIGQDGNHK